jgi:hypothetical protein
MTDSIYLGQVKQQVESTQSYNPEKDNLYILGEQIYLKKHNWDCGWYWGFGYIGNKHLHCHASVFTHELIWHNVNEVFNKSIFKSNDDFWIFKDLLKQAYTLQQCAEIYQYGGHCITHKKTKVINNKTKAKTINRDLEKVLDQLWNFLKGLEK